MAHNLNIYNNDPRAESFDILVNGVVRDNVPIFSGYTVTVSGVPSYEAGRVYDGTGTDGIDLGVATNGTYTITSGHLCAYYAGQVQSSGTVSGGVSLNVGLSDEYKFVYDVAADGTISNVYWSCFVEGTKITLADGTEKNVEDVTFDDELLVWDFYKGKLTTAKPKYMLPSKKTSYHYETELENGTIIKTVGKYGHRLFNVDKNEFIYDTECVDDYVLLENGEKSKVVSCKKVEEETEFFNIITDKHYNLFANGILTSCRLSNRYGIENMKYTDEEKMTEAEVNDYIDKLKFKGFKGVE